jgi:COP9 signalosome complex subunit 5
LPRRLRVTLLELTLMLSDSSQVSLEASHGLIGALLKDSLFNGGRLANQGGNSDEFKLPPVVS